ncbi:MAG TPA: four helix bundle protein [Prolixibacteraceae bacterium]|jgi:four helix bundle protein|nr:four helix bundle protein [Prolixibacteraceae bacterium]HPJ79090.1 four helix bundle protein [Prolixibacteraceae bacterium]HRV89311.1 four helix bundle protein [Prolixibacteraceae bacterium]
MAEKELSKRLFRFAVLVIKFLGILPEKPEFNNIRYQLSKSSTSSGANYEEAQAASSRPDFSYKVDISLKEMRESNFWLRIIDETITLPQTKHEELKYLINESSELALILGSIVLKSKHKPETNTSM